MNGHFDCFALSANAKIFCSSWVGGTTYLFFRPSWVGGTTYPFFRPSWVGGTTYRRTTIPHAHTSTASRSVRTLNFLFILRWRYDASIFPSILSRRYDVSIFPSILSRRYDVSKDDYSSRSHFDCFALSANVKFSVHSALAVRRIHFSVHPEKEVRRIHFSVRPE